MTHHRRRCHRRALASAIVSTLTIASPLYANVIDNTWLGGNGSRNDATKWSAGVVPNNNSTDTFRAAVPGGSIVSSGSIGLDSLTPLGPASLNCSDVSTWNVGGPVQIDGNMQMGAYSRMVLGPAGTVEGVGTLTLNTSGSGTLTTASGGLSIDNGVTVRFRNENSLVGRFDSPFVNRGHIIVERGADTANYTPKIGGTSISNTGIMEAHAGIVSLIGTYSRADLGTLVFGPSGHFTIGGTLLNQNETLVVDAANPWYLGGTIKGGTIETRDNQRLFVHFYGAGTFDGVTCNGKVEVDGGSRLYVVGGNLTGNGEVLLNHAYEMPGRVVSPTGGVTIGPGMLVHGGAGGGDEYGLGCGVGESGFSPIVNHGTLRADTPGAPSGGNTCEFSVVGSSLFNDGTVSVASMSFMTLSRSYFSVSSSTLTFGTGGVLEVGLSTTDGLGLLRVLGKLDLSTAGDSLILSAGPDIVPGQFYRIVTTRTAIAGQFDSVTPGFEVMYQGNDIFARLVPEPTCIALLAVAGLLLRRRREI